MLIMTKPVDVNGPPFAFADVDMQISQTVTTVAVAFELFCRKEEKIIEIGLHCVHTNLVFSETFNRARKIGHQVII